MTRTGVDIVETERIERLVKEQGDRFLERCFTPEERLECERAAGSVHRYAGTFAVKEAVYKALRLKWEGPFSWKDVVVERKDEAPTVSLHGRLSPLEGKYAIDVSISHCRSYSVAVAVLEEKVRSASFGDEMSLH